MKFGIFILQVEAVDDPVCLWFYILSQRQGRSKLMGKLHIGSVMQKKLECAVSNPHAQVFTPEHPKVPPLGHDPGNRMKIPFDMFHIFNL